MGFGFTIGPVKRKSKIIIPKLLCYIHQFRLFDSLRQQHQILILHNPAISNFDAAGYALGHFFVVGDHNHGLALADKLARKPEELPDLLRNWVSWWRDLTLLFFGGGEDEPLTNVDLVGQLAEVASIWTAGHVVDSLRQTEKALWQLEHNANTRLVLENLFLVYPSRK